MSSRNFNSRISKEIVGQVAKYKYNGTVITALNTTEKKKFKVVGDAIN